MGRQVLVFNCDEVSHLSVFIIYTSSSTWLYFVFLNCLVRVVFNRAETNVSSAHQIHVFGSL